MASDIQVHVETGSGPVTHDLGAPQRRGFDVRLLVLVVLVAIVGVIWWLGDQTPEQSVPVTTQPTPTTSTTSAVFLNASPFDPETVSAAFGLWMKDLAGERAQAQLQALDGEVMLVYSAPLPAKMTAVGLSAAGWTTTDLRCDGSVGLGPVYADLGDHLIFQVSGRMCVVPKDGSLSPAPFEGVKKHVGFIAEDEESGWFCSYQTDSVRVARYRLGEDLGPWLEAPSCPRFALDGAVLVRDLPEAGDTSAQLGPFWWVPGESIPSDPDYLFEGCNLLGVIGKYALCRIEEVIRIYDFTSGELAHQQQNLIPPGTVVDGSMSSSGRYIFMQWIDPTSSTNQNLGGVILDLEKPVASVRLLAVTSELQSTWTSDDQLIMLVLPLGRTCADCESLLISMDPETGESETLLQIPPEVVVGSLQLLDG